MIGYNRSIQVVKPGNYLYDGLPTLVKIEFSSKTIWVTSWNVLDGRNKILVSSPTTAKGGMSLYRKKWDLAKYLSYRYGSVGGGSSRPAV